MAESVRFAITVTLRPALYRYTSVEQYDMTSDELVKHLLSECIKVSLIAEHTKNFNIHYHGIVTMRHIINGSCQKRLVDSFRKSKHFGFVCIKQIEDEEGWIDYMSKELLETSSLLGRMPILIDNFDNILDKNSLDYNRLRNFSYDLDFQ